MEICDWIRLRMHEVLGRDLDTEVRSGYLFGFSLAGLDKLRSKSLATTDVSVLFQLPINKISCIDDGSAHLVASMKTLESRLPKGPIWNFSVGTGVGFGFTDSNHTVRNPSDFIEFFDYAPWHVKEPLTGLDVTFACSGLAFDKIVANRKGIIDDSIFLEFASRWKAFIDFKILKYSKTISPNKHWGTPAAIVFTGGHIDMHGDCLVDTLHELNIDVPVFTGPKNAGLLGAAWNAIKAENIAEIHLKKNEDIP